MATGERKPLITLRSLAAACTGGRFFLRTLNLAVIWLMSGMNSCRSLASQSFSMCSEAAGMKGSTSSSRQMIIRCRKERTELRSTPRWTGQLSAGRKVCRQSL